MLLHSRNLIWVAILFLPSFGWGSGIFTPGSGSLSAGSTNYIQNNPQTVQTATMTITGPAQFDHSIYTVYSSSPTSKPTGSVWLAQVPSSSVPCFWIFDGANNRFRICATLDNAIVGDILMEDATFILQEDGTKIGLEQ